MDPVLVYSFFSQLSKSSIKDIDPLYLKQSCKDIVYNTTCIRPVVIKLSVLSDLSDICTFGPILKALLQDQMSDRSLKSLHYNIDHKILNTAPTGSYDLSIDLSDCVKYEFSIYYNIGFESLS